MHYLLLIGGMALAVFIGVHTINDYREHIKRRNKPPYIE